MDEYGDIVSVSWYLLHVKSKIKVEGGLCDTEEEEEDSEHFTGLLKEQGECLTDKPETESIY